MKLYQQLINKIREIGRVCRAVKGIYGHRLCFEEWMCKAKFWYYSSTPRVLADFAGRVKPRLNGKFKNETKF